MEKALDMSLDDLIKKNRKDPFRNRGRENLRVNHSGDNRRFFDRSHAKGTPYFLNLPRRGMGERATVGDASYSNAGTKLYVSNLDDGVSNEDIKVLFSDVGALKRYAIHYDLNGRSQGTAEVVYVRHSDALSAIKRYDDVHLDGRPIKIELVGFDVDASAIPPAPAAYGRSGYGGGALRSNIRNGRRQGLGHGQASGTKREHREKVSAEALDADLDTYHQDR